MTMTFTFQEYTPKVPCLLFNKRLLKLEAFMCVLSSKMSVFCSSCVCSAVEWKGRREKKLPIQSCVLRAEVDVRNLVCISVCNVC